MSQIIMITGCSSGIGRDLASRLSSAGYTVIATARRLEALENLQASMKLPLDVTRQDSVDQAAAQAIRCYGRIDVLVNNAGFALRGAVEEVPVDQAQAVFDANLFGVMRMIQAVVPCMRQQGYGRIINISSVVGKLVTPANGIYSSSKFALEGLSNALRMELAPFGIKVVLVEPGSIKTRFHETMEANGREIFTDPSSPYRPLYQKYAAVNDSMRQQEAGPEAVSQVVQRIIELRQPKNRYVAGFNALGKLVFFLGDPVWDRVVQQLFKI